MALEFIKANGLWNEGTKRPKTLATVELARNKFSKELYVQILQAYAELAAMPASRKRAAVSSSSDRKAQKVEEDSDSSTATELHCILCNVVIEDGGDDEKDPCCHICAEIGPELKTPDRIKALVYNVQKKHPQPRTRFSPLSFWSFAKMTDEDHHVQCLINQKQYEDLLNAPCSYCLLAPAGHVTRLSPVGDYAIDTVVACCPICLSLKGNLRDSTFLRQVKTIADAYEQSIL